jgi:hypothetical protein
LALFQQQSFPKQQVFQVDQVDQLYQVEQVDQGALVFDFFFSLSLFK